VVPLSSGEKKRIRGCVIHVPGTSQKRLPATVISTRSLSFLVARATLNKFCFAFSDYLDPAIADPARTGESETVWQP
jgi:hypothetical protein